MINKPKRLELDDKAERVSHQFKNDSSASFHDLDLVA
jgi:hypothetical protein